MNPETQTQETNTETQTTDTATDQEQQQGKTPKMFTEDEVNEIIKGRVAKEAKRLEKAHENTDEYKAYKKWQEENQTATEKTEKALKEQNESIAKLTAQLQQKTVEAANVDKDYIEFVTLKSNAMATEKNIDFEEALTEFLKETGDKFLKQTEADNNPKVVTPSGSVSNSAITQEQFKKMSYKEKVDIFNKDPNLYNKLKG